MRAARIVSISLLLGSAWLVACAGPSNDSPEWATGFVASTDGVPIYYKIAGEGPISLVFVHGWSCDHTYWSGQLDRFAEDYRVVAVDLAGHGESGSDREVWTISSLGSDVMAVIESLDLDRAVLVGHSMGGLVIVETAKLAAGQIIGLVAVDVFFDLDGVYAMTPAETEEFLAPFVDDFVGATRQLVGEGMFAPTSDSALVARIVADMSSATPEVGIGLLRDYIRWWGEPFDALALPVVAMNSDMWPTNTASLQRHGLAHVTMPGVGHFVMIEDPDTFNGLLAESIEEF
jgi:pimeloyl-ACP methyl ester carboxylesterase